jgi:hypothetical protein
LLLNQINQQTIQPKKIIIVDNSDVSCPFSLPDHIEVCVYPRDVEFHFSVALNFGMEKTVSATVAIVSPHVRIKKKDTFEVMIKGLWDHGCSGVYAGRGSATSLPQEDSKVPLWTLVHLDNYTGFNALHNSFSMIRRDLWQMHQFVEWLNSTEDQEWALWHYKNSGLPTAVIRSHLYVYENYYDNCYKAVRDYLTVGHYFYPKFFSLTSVIKHLLKSVRALLQCNGNEFRRNVEIVLAIPFARRLVPRMSCRTENKASVLFHLW